ncbi:hypothetical protein QT327_26000, partial [Olivibacter sp. 47]|uniref:hypothetical protein n=1 Tax=Olivibacter sp. 47 TaxID=3056486 RepID=UPI0025A3F7E8
MIKLALSKLELARVNLSAVVQGMLHDTGPGGSQGFTAKWKTVVRDYHEEDREFDFSLKKMDDTLWQSFKETSVNTSRRKLFCDSFKDYVKEFKDLGLTIDKFQLNLNWQIIPQAKITGHSPFLCSIKDKPIAYYFSETGGNWRTELKYPILQIFLAEYFYKCNVEEVQIGIYNIKERKFEL